MPKLWYVLQSKPHKEEALHNQLILKDIEVFYPRLRVCPVNPRSRNIRPFFPGYLFVHVDLQDGTLPSLQYMPYVSRLVCFGREAAVVPDALIFELRRKLEVIHSDPNAMERGEYKPGEEVEIIEGPLRGYRAIFDLNLSGTQRVRVLLEMLSHQKLPIELNAGQIRKTVPRRPR